MCYLRFLKKFRELCSFYGYFCPSALKIPAKTDGEYTIICGDFPEIVQYVVNAEELPNAVKKFAFVPTFCYHSITKKTRGAKERL